MKKSVWLWAALVVAAVLFDSSCWVYSLHPLVEQADSLKEPQLAGAWERQGKDKDEKGTLTIAVAPKGYALEYLDQDGEHSKLRGFLTQIGSNRFLDVDVNEESLEIPEAAKAHLVPAHSVWKVSLEGDMLRLTPMNDDWLKEQFKSKKVTLAHYLMEDEVVLEASTAELRAFVQRYANEAFPQDKAWTFKRR